MSMNMSLDFSSNMCKNIDRIDLQNRVGELEEA